MNKEFLRMQQLAGLITENEYKHNIEEEETQDPEALKDAEAGLKAALNTLKSGINTIKPSPQDKELKESVTLTVGLVAGAPGLLNLLGRAVNKVSSFFQKDKKKGTVVGNTLKTWGHALEESYLGIIGDMLVKAFPTAYEGQDVHDKTSPLYDAAHTIYAGILAATALTSGMGAAEAHNVIATGLEGGLAAFKSAEVIDLAKKIAAA
jgi:hypothetical protein